ncbi:MAG TPA: class I SAM-dependent methyltransferase [Ktedonobacterales bacterium]|nr:class I SAM-dependent methyltransferase [Ktedonobacterales bacterium]
MDQLVSSTDVRPLSRQEFYRQMYQRLSPGWKDSLARYCEVIAAYILPETRILDIGCGHADFLAPVYARTPHTYGIDPDGEAIRKNTLINNTMVGTAECLPFADDSFDLIVAAWVFEHIEHPEQACREIYRALKPGGRLIFLTPNSWNYNVWMIRLVPHRFHDFFTRRLYHRQEHDTYRVRYKINSPRKIARTLLPLGFREERVILNGDPSYISFNSLLFAFARFLERLFDVKLLQRARVHIIGVYQKPSKQALSRSNARQGW